MDMNGDPVNTDVLLNITKDIIKKTKSDESFFVCNLADVAYKFKLWREKLPRIQPYYAVKCLPDPAVLKLMVSLGVRFDCASKDEIDIVFKAGAQPSDIIYAHPFKPVSYLHYACSVGVDFMTFDSAEELYKIKEEFPEARLLIRFRIDNVKAVYPLSPKFGCHFHDCQTLLALAKKLKLNIIGVSFHVGSLCQEPSAYSRAITMSREIFEIAEEMGFVFTILDIGGGYAGNTYFREIFDEMCYNIITALDENFSNRKNLEIIAEPGCYFVCSAFSLCVKIIGKKEIEQKDNVQESPRMYYLNDSIYGSFAPGFETWGCKILPLLNEEEFQRRQTYTSKIWGSSCCSMDCVFEKYLLPDLKIGEYLLVDNMGAYTLSVVSSFCGLPKPRVYYIYAVGNKYDPAWQKATENFLEKLNFEHNVYGSPINGFKKIPSSIKTCYQNGELHANQENVYLKCMIQNGKKLLKISLKN